MSEGLKHLSKKRPRAESGIGKSHRDPAYVYTYGEGVKKMKPGSFQLRPVTQQKARGTKKKTRNSI